MTRVHDEAPKDGRKDEGADEFPFPDAPPRDYEVKLPEPLPEKVRYGAIAAAVVGALVLALVVYGVLS